MSVAAKSNLGAQQERLISELGLTTTALQHRVESVSVELFRQEINPYP